MKRMVLMSLLAGVMVLGGTGCVNRAAQAQAQRTEKLLSDPARVVKVAPVKTTTVTEMLEITGDVTAGEDTQVAAKQPGKLVSVLVKDGDTVGAGQLIATTDTTQLQAQVQQAQAQVSSALAQANQARSALQQALRNAAVGPTRSAAATRQAQAQLRSARAQLQKALNGARPEERRQAEANVTSARTNLQTQERELRRIETLVREGALAGNRLDQQRNATESARTQFENAQEALNLVRSGTRSEDIEVARSAVRQAEEAVQSARASQELDPLLRDQVESARQQVRAAEGQVQSARAAVTIAQQTLADTQIRAPFAGRVAGRPLQVGTVVSPSTPIVRIIGGAGVYFTGRLPSVEVARVQPGMPVDVKVGALQGRTFPGTVAAVSPLGESVGRLFDVRIQLLGGFNDVRPGMFARGQIVVRRVQNATIVPQTAIVTRDGQSLVFSAVNGKAKAYRVTTGLRQGTSIQVTGVPAGTQIIVDGQQNLSDGNDVRVETTTPQAKKEAGANGS